MPSIRPALNFIMGDLSILSSAIQMDWTPAHFDLTKEPSLLSTITINVDPEFPGNFPRVAKWSPDGSVILSQCENRTFELFDVSSEPPHHTNNNKTFVHAAPILDFIWFPTASPLDPASFCFVASVRECPVKLLDASDGRLRASYPIVDHRERQIAPHSLAFNLTGQRLYCGFENAIEVFDISRPGVEGRRIHTTPTRKSKDGLKGIVSAIAFSAAHYSAESYYAAGTFTSSPNNIALFSDAQDEPLMYLGGGPRAGVTQLQFNPMKPHILYAAFRGSATGKIYSWDVRSNLDSPVEIFQVPNSASSKVNQKLRFDVELAGRMLGVGDQFGDISIFQLDDGEAQMGERHSDFTTHDPILHFKANHDAVGSVAFHPYRPSILSVSGSRHFTDLDEDQIGEESDPEDDGSFNIVKRLVRTQPVVFDSSIKVWDFTVQEAIREG